MPDPILEHPDQPLFVDPDGVVRFKPNRIVRVMLDLLKERGVDLNELHIRCPAHHDRSDVATEGDDPDAPLDAGDFSRDWEQVNQLMGYSVSGYGDLSYIRRTVVNRCDAAANALLDTRRGR